MIGKLPPNANTPFSMSCAVLPTPLLKPSVSNIKPGPFASIAYEAPGVNGNLSEWAQHRAFGSDPDDVAATNQVDFVAAWMGHDTNRFFLAIETDIAVYSTSSQSRMNTAVNKSRTLNDASLYITHDALPNPWDTLPTYWSA